MRMTYKQFLEHLEKERQRVDWRLTRAGTIRCKRCGVWCDPITAISQRVGTGVARLGDSGHVAAKMGLGPKVSLRILEASDNVRGHSCTVRNDLLRATGLLSDTTPFCKLV